jgi:non-hemolytic enterotoxin B/C
VLPGAIETITNIDAYFQVQNALAEALQPDTDARFAITLLKAVQDQATDFHSQANRVVTDLQGVRDRISTNTTDFNAFAGQLDTVLNCDDGVLSSINEQLGNIDGKIAGAATGVALSALAIAGGVVMIVVGAAADAVTGGASTALGLGGVGILVAGVGGEVGSSVALAKMLELKSDLLRQQVQLPAEATLASGMASGFRTLSDQSAAAVEPTQGMANAWTLLGSDLEELAAHLERGETTVPALRKLFTVAARGDVRTIQADVATIRGQLTGVRIAADPKTNVVSLVKAAAEQGIRFAA